MLIEKTAAELLDAFSDPSPTPGGGSAAALAASLGASLFLMVSALPKTRGGDDDRAALDAAAGEIRPLQTRLRDLVDLDAAAYDAVLGAYRMPKGTDAERKTRQEAIQRGLRQAIEAPLAVMECSAHALEQGGVVAAHGSVNAASDVGVGIELLLAGLKGANLNVEVNLGGVTDAPFADSVKHRVVALQNLAVQSADQAKARLVGL